MKIAYTFARDASKPSVQSGRPASILRGLQRAGVEIEPVFPLAARMPRTATLKKAMYRAFGRHYRGDRETSYLAALAREVEQRIEPLDVEVIFSPGSEATSLIETGVPVTFCADATFANLVDYYWDFAGLASEYIEKGHRQETASLARAALAVYPSEWAANAAIQTYGADPARVAVIPFGANLGAGNQRAEVEGWVENRGRERLRLLFVGRHWMRKGGEIVVAAARLLIQRGLRVQLDVVGCPVPARHRGLSWIQEHGSLSPNVPDEVAALSRLFAAAHFVFVPSRAEAYGMTFAEANAFGVPAVATATGGIPAIITDGKNGRALPLEADAAAYADAIEEAYASPSRYEVMCARAFEEFETRLNWTAFCAHYLRRVAQILKPDPSHATALSPQTNRTTDWSAVKKGEAWKP